MKDQYVGDIGDYFKYAYLRRIAKAVDQPLIVCWMFTPSDTTNDGKDRPHLKDRDLYRPVDPDLYDALEGMTTIADVEASGLIDAQFFNREVPLDPEARHRYLADLEPIIQSDSIVFFDPDNGLEVRSVNTGNQKAPKFLFLDEYAQTARANRSVLIYQHYPRVDRDSYALKQLDRLREYREGYEYFALHGPRALTLCAIAPDGPDLMSPAQDLAAAWPSDKVKVTRLPDHDGPVPPRGGWLPLEFPERFVLESLDPASGEWLEWATYERSQILSREEDNVYLASSDGMPIYFRCVSQEGNEFESVAGTGEHIRYRITAIDAPQ